MGSAEKYYRALLVVQDFTEGQLRQKWKDEYCSQVIHTHDGIRVHFYESNFDHAFFESSERRHGSRTPKSKDVFSPRRAARMMWIKDVLADPEAEMFVGYDSKSKNYTGSKRVSVVKGDYVVVIQIYAERKANFITAYVADNSIDKIKSGPKWETNEDAENKKDAD